MTGMPRSLLTRLAEQAAAHAREGALTLQVCTDCERAQYPYREICRQCLSDRLSWRRVDDRGRVLAISGIYASRDPWFRERAPWRVASVALAAGPTVIAHLDSAQIQQDHTVRVRQTFIDPTQCVLIAYEEDA